MIIQLILAAILSCPSCAGNLDAETLKLAKYFLRTPTAETDPKRIDQFLKIQPETLPEKMRGEVAAKQVEILALLRLHDTKKAGSIISPAENCSAKDFIKPLKLAPFFGQYDIVTEDELRYVMDRTKCTEVDLGCRFTLLIFFEKKKDRILKLMPNDPSMALIAEFRGKQGGGTKFFGGFGMTCMH